MRQIKSEAPLLRLVVGAGGVLRVEGLVRDSRERNCAFGICARLTPAIRRFDKAIRKEFT